MAVPAPGAGLFPNRSKLEATHRKGRLMTAALASPNQIAASITNHLSAAGRRKNFARCDIFLLRRENGNICNHLRDKTVGFFLLFALGRLQTLRLQIFPVRISLNKARIAKYNKIKKFFKMRKNANIKSDSICRN
jgi:hypothetical protein